MNNRMGHPLAIGTRIGWVDHWTNGGSGVTKFKPEETELYRSALESWDATGSKLRIRIDQPELHFTNGFTDLSGFWEIFYKLRAARPANEGKEG